MSGNSVPIRKNYLDNIRSVTIVLVVIYHVAYIFNSGGVISNLPVKGIQALDRSVIFSIPGSCVFCLWLPGSAPGMHCRHAAPAISLRQGCKN